MRPFGDRRIVGEIRLAQHDGPFRARPGSARTESLAASARHEARRATRSRRPRRRPIRASACRRRQGGQAPWRSPMAAIVRSIRPASTKGRTASWISTWLGHRRAARARPSATIPVWLRRRGHGSHPVGMRACRLLGTARRRRHGWRRRSGRFADAAEKFQRVRDDRRGRRCGGIASARRPGRRVRRGRPRRSPRRPCRVGCSADRVHCPLPRCIRRGRSAKASTFPKCAAMWRHSALRIAADIWLENVQSRRSAWFLCMSDLLNWPSRWTSAVSRSATACSSRRCRGSPTSRSARAPMRMAPGWSCPRWWPAANSPRAGPAPRPAHPPFRPAGPHGAACRPRGRITWPRRAHRCGRGRRHHRHQHGLPGQEGDRRLCRLGADARSRPCADADRRGGRRGRACRSRSRCGWAGTKARSTRRCWRAAPNRPASGW